MNPIERAIRRADAVQQRHKASAFVFGIVKKYGDDNGGALTSNLAHSAFVSLFPLLLVMVTILGLVASGDPALRHQALNAVTRQVPLIGHQLAGNVHQLRRASVVGLTIGFLALVWAGTRLGQAGLFTMAQVWNLPGPDRPGYVQRLGRAALFLGVLGLGVIVTTLLTSLASYGHDTGWIVALGDALAVAANIGMYLAGFRVLTAKSVPARQLVPGAVAGGVAWTVLQALGAFLVHHFLRSDSVYGVFGTVLGLFTWIYLGVEVTVYAAEINVVLARRLWPRSIVQPPLTEADRAVLSAQALQNQRRADQHVTVSFVAQVAGAAAPASTPALHGRGTGDSYRTPGNRVSGLEPADIREWTGHDVVDADGHAIGALEAVYADTGSGRPFFGAVRVGVAAGHRLVFVPLDHATAGPGYLRVCYDRELVRNAPSAGTGGELPAGGEGAIFRHYGLTCQPGADGAAAGPLGIPAQRTAR